MTAPQGLAFINELCGLPCSDLRRRRFPKSRDWCHKAVAHLGLTTQTVRTNGGEAIAVPLEVLPADTHAALLQRRAGTHAPAEPLQGDAAAWERFGKAPKRQGDEAHRRFEVVIRFGKLRSERKSRRAATAIIKSECGVGRGSLNGWLKRIEGIPESDWLPALLPGYKPHVEYAEFSEDIWLFFLADFLRENGPKLTTAYNRAQREAKARGLPWAGRKAVYNRLHREYTDAQIVWMRQGRKAYERTHPPIGRARAQRAGDVWAVDGIFPSVLVRWPDGHQGLASIARGICEFSNLPLGYEIDKFENGDQIRRLILKIEEKYGLPRSKKIITDNGRALANKVNTGGQPDRYRWPHKPGEVRGFLTRLGIRVDFIQPGKSHHNPAERSNREIKELIEKDPRCADYYCGDNPRLGDRDRRRPVVGMPLDEYINVVEDAHNILATQEGRRTEACGGTLSYAQAHDKSMRESNEPPTHLSNGQRRLFALHSEKKRCHKRSGEIRVLKDNRFWSEELQEHRGEDVLVYYDADRVHDGIFVETLDGRHICRARCIEKGSRSRAMARDEARLRKDKTRKDKAAIQAASKLSLHQLNAQLTPVPPHSPPPPAAVRIVHPGPAIEPTAAAAKTKHAAAKAAVLAALDAPNEVSDDTARQETAHG